MEQPGICKKYWSKTCFSNQGECGKVHLCSYYLQTPSTCKYGERCKSGHKLNSNHNTNVLHLFPQSRVTISGLRQMLQQKPPRVAKICSFYSNKGGCENGFDCQFLHICYYFLKGRCTKKRCPLNHNIRAPQPLRILQNCGYDSSLPEDDLLEMIDREEPGTRHIEPFPRTGLERSSSPERTFFDDELKVSDGDFSDSSKEDGKAKIICVFNLVGTCKHGRECRYKHAKRQFLWQRRSDDSTSDWIDFDDNQQEIIETAFCKPENTVYIKNGISPIELDFSHMRMSFGSEIRRLSTPSQSQEPHLQGATRWAWYRHNSDTSSWVSLPRGGEGCTSEALEEAFNDGLQSMQFDGKDDKIIVYLQRMKCYSSLKKQYSDIIRRPVEHVSREDTNHTDLFEVPEYWDPWDYQSTAYKLVELPRTSTEFLGVLARFVKSMGQTVNVKKIERVQNRDLWLKYSLKRARLTRVLDPSRTERLLYHGTHAQCIDPICRTGFDPRVSGSNSAEALGQGSYFAVSAKYSDKDRFQDKYDRKMFEVKVLVGESTLGCSSYRRPPPKNPSKPFGDLYDSCVNNLKNPQKFVVFEVDSAYPSYVISYK